MIQAIYKPLGLTPLQALEKFRANNPQFNKSRMTYAGRLDPMAEGVLLLLIDEDQNTKEQVLSWGKEYEFEMLAGISTDSYDLLGLVGEVQPLNDGVDLVTRINEVREKCVGRIRQIYPPFSSKVVEGKPLWQWAKEGNIDQIDIPDHEIFIETIEVGGIRQITGEELQKVVKNKITQVSGDFRQEKIINRWKKMMRNHMKDIFSLVNMKVVCSSGTYVRQLVVDIGSDINVPTTTFEIKRTRVGLLKVNNCVSV